MSSSKDGVAEQAWAKLAILEPNRTMHHLKKDNFKIGRSRSCDLIFSEVFVSSVQCIIYKGVEVEDGVFQAVIEDCSSNGTIVKRGDQDTFHLNKGDKKALRIGDIVIFREQNARGTCVSFRIHACDPPVTSNGSVLDSSGLEFGRYKLLKNLGSGSFAQVKLAFDVPNNSLVALKYIDKEHFYDCIHTMRPEARTAEIDLLKSIRHENIVAFKGEHDSEEFTVLVLEYVTGGELFDHVATYGRMPEAEAKAGFRQLVAAVKYLHENGIAHRDLKPENILIQTKIDGTRLMKVTDFGLSRLVPLGSVMQSVAGSPGYYAPEIMLQDGKGYTKKVDIWSLGVILYIMLSGIPPYDARLKRAEIVRRSIRFPMPMFNGVSRCAKDLVLACLDVNPETRLSATQLSQHQWLVGDRQRRLVADGHSNNGSSSSSSDKNDRKRRMAAPGQIKTHHKRKHPLSI